MQNTTGQMKNKIIRVAALSDSLRILLKGQLKYLNTHFEIIGVGSGIGSSKQLAMDEGIKTIPLRIERKISPVQDLRSLYKLYRLFRKEKPFMVHSITPKAGLLSMLAAYFAGVPNRAHTFTGLVFPSRTGLMRSLLIFFNRIICFCATDLYPEGQGVKNDLLHYKITKKPLKIISNGNVNGIDVAHFSPDHFNPHTITAKREELNITASDFVFLYVGRLVSEKGITELLGAFSELSHRHSNIKLVLVGPYENKHDPLPKKTLDAIKNNDNVIETGFQHDVRPYFAICDVFVFPSYREGFPNVVLQCGAMGKFSIVTDINGSNEIIESGVNGEIVPIKNKEALKNAMSDCLQNKEKYHGSNESIRDIISKKYQQQIVWDGTLKEYLKKK